MMQFPKIIQGGMGVGVSNWRLANAVSKIGQLGVVSGTALDSLFVRRLASGDPEGDMRRGLDAFPFPEMAERLIHSRPCTSAATCAMWSSCAS
jgi:nitronate monooxygenase